MGDVRHQLLNDLLILPALSAALTHQVIILHKFALDPVMDTMSGQINKLDFLLQSLIKMSRLETGTFALHIEFAAPETLEHLIALLFRNAHTGIRNIHTGIELPWTDADPDTQELLPCI